MALLMPCGFAAAAACHPWCICPAQALATLAVSHRALLAQYSSYLANVLDHLEGFSDSQLRQVFATFAAVTAVQPGAGSSSASMGKQAGSRDGVGLCGGRCALNGILQEVQQTQRGCCWRLEAAQLAHNA
jgi:hypothetical protein